MPARSLQGGAIHSGLSYGPNFMMHPLIPFLETARSAGGVDYFHTPNPADSAWLREMAYFLIYCVQPDMNHVNYADVATENPAKQVRFMLDIFASEYDNGYAAEMANRISERFKTSGYHAEWIYLYFAFHNPSIKPRPLAGLPVARVFAPRSVGQVFWRSDWSADGTLVHFRCGDYFEDHGHFDQGSFTIFHRGKLALKGGGYWGFHSAYRLHYYKQAISTNTVIFNDPSDPKDEGRQRNVKYMGASTLADYLAHKNPTTQPCVETGDILADDDSQWVSSTSKNLHSVVADVTAAWDSKKVKRYVRSLAFVDDKYLIVVDETETTTPDIRARWLLHTQVEPKAFSRNGGGVGTVKPPIWSVNLPKSAMLVSIVEPAKPKVALIGGEGHECEVNGVNYPYTGTKEYGRRSRNGEQPKPEPEAGLWRMEVEYPRGNTNRTFVAVLTVGEPEVAPPVVEAVQSKAGLTVKVNNTQITFKGLPGQPGQAEVGSPR
ncbi:MAG: heparinase II/III family protein [Phycisphaerae bacterium]|nr:heparinase II/III family protein [Phycisphaerae bacterium]